MTNEDKQLLIKDIYARLPYGVIVHNEEGYEGHLNSINQTIFGIELGVNITSTRRVDFQLDTCKPYLRPMSSMTEEEKSELQNKFCYGWNYKDEGIWDFFNHHKIYGADAELLIDWLNSHYFDYRGLIEKGLALEAPEDMYKTE